MRKKHETEPVLLGCRACELEVSLRSAGESAHSVTSSGLDLYVAMIQVLKGSYYNSPHSRVARESGAHRYWQASRI